MDNENELPGRCRRVLVQIKIDEPITENETVSVGSRCLSGIGYDDYWEVDGHGYVHNDIIAKWMPIPDEISQQVNT